MGHFRRADIAHALARNDGRCWIDRWGDAFEMLSSDGATIQWHDHTWRPRSNSKGRGGTETVDRGLPEVNSSISRTTVWMQLEEHFARHASMVERFQGFGRAAVVGMWQAQTNESGDPLTPAEREALVERHCELFGHWPA